LSSTEVVKKPLANGTDEERESKGLLRIAASGL